jgi:hypothetical protein
VAAYAYPALMRALSIVSWLLTGAWLAALTVGLYAAHVGGATVVVVMVVACATTVAGFGAAIATVAMPRDNPVPIRILAALHAVCTLALGALGVIMAVLVVAALFISTISAAVCRHGCQMEVPYQVYVLIGVSIAVFASQVTATAMTARAALRQRAFSNQ